MNLTKTSSKTTVEAKLDNFKNWNGGRYMTIIGSGKPSVINQAKAKAIVAAYELVKKFASGELNELIDSCADGEIVRVGK